MVELIEDALNSGGVNETGLGAVTAGTASRSMLSPTLRSR
jgi:hypothetical protein